MSTGFQRKRQNCPSKGRPKNNFRLFRPLTLPSPARGEGIAEKLFFGRSYAGARHTATAKTTQPTMNDTPPIGTSITRAFDSVKTQP